MITKLKEPAEHFQWCNPTSKCCIFAVVFHSTQAASDYLYGSDLERDMRYAGIDFLEERDGFIPNCVTERCAGYAHHTRLRMAAGGKTLPWYVDVITINAEACEAAESEPLAVFVHEVTHAIQYFERSSVLDGGETQAYVIETCVNAYLETLSKQTGDGIREV